MFLPLPLGWLLGISKLPRLPTPELLLVFIIDDNFNLLRLLALLTLDTIVPAHPLHNSHHFIFCGSYDVFLIDLIDTYACRAKTDMSAFTPLKLTFL